MKARRLSDELVNGRWAVMGERAYVAYERPDGTYNLHYSHWGATNLHLVSEISETTPLGGETTEPEYTNEFIRMLESSGDQKPEGNLTETQTSTEVEPDPVATAVPRKSIPDHVNFITTDALYVVDRDWNVAGYEVWNLSFDSTDTGYGILFEPESDEDEVEIVRNQGWLEGLRTAFSHLIDEDRITSSEAREALLHTILDEKAWSLTDRIAEFSPVITDDLIERYPTAFSTPDGVKRGEDGRPEAVDRE